MNSEFSEHQVIVNLDLTLMEKEVIREFLRLKQENSPVLLIGAQDLKNFFEKREIIISRPRAYAILMQLEEKKMVDKINRKGFLLTNYGNEVMSELLHRTKILETYFHTELDLNLKIASNEASNVVLHVSFQLIETLCNKLGKPVSCPHDIKIPQHKKHPNIKNLM